MANRFKLSHLADYVSNMSFRNKFYFILFFMATWILFLTFATYYLRLEWVDLLSNRYSAIHYQEPLGRLVNTLSIYEIEKKKRETNEVNLNLIKNQIDELVEQLEQILKPKWYHLFSYPSWLNQETIQLLKMIIDQWTIFKEENLSPVDKKILINSMTLNALKAMEEINISASLVISDNFALLRISRMVNERIPQISHTLTVIDRELEQVQSDPITTIKQTELQLSKINDLLINSAIDRKIFSLVDEKLNSNQPKYSLVTTFKSMINALQQLSDHLIGEIRQPLKKSMVSKREEILNTLYSIDLMSKTLNPPLKEEYRKLRNSEYMQIFSILLLNVFLLLLVLVVWPSRSMKEPLHHLIQGIRNLRKGHYDVSVVPEGQNEVTEISHLFNTIAKTLNGTFSRISNASKVFSEQSDIVNDNIKHLTANVIERAEQFKEISTRLKNVLRKVLPLTTVLDEVHQSIKITIAHSSKGETLLEEATTSIRQIQQIAKEVHQELYQFQNGITETNQIIDAIIKIVDQANLLYLNSSIHANKSGEMGRGFAIISDKIHELANISAYFTLDIEKTVNGLIPQLNEVSELIECFSSEIGNQERDAGAVKDQIQIFIKNTINQVELYNSLITETNHQANLTHTINQLVLSQSQKAAEIRNGIRNLQKGANHVTEATTEFTRYRK